MQYTLNKIGSYDNQKECWIFFEVLWLYYRNLLSIWQTTACV